MLITYRRTGGVLALLAVAGVAFAATIFTVAVAAAVLVVALAVGVVAVVGRAVAPARWRHSSVSPATPWAGKTIDTTAITPAETDKDSSERE